MEKELKETKAVPFQLCPKCQGEGTVPTNYLENMSICMGEKVCDVCNGAKVIPMCVIR